jgi:hypothetical protein
MTTQNQKTNCDLNLVHRLQKLITGAEVHDLNGKLAVYMGRARLPDIESQKIMQKYEKELRMRLYDLEAARISQFMHV